jgi:hypothetical protein
VGYTTEDSASHPYVLPATMPAGLPAGGTYSKVVVKAGHTGTSVVHENTVYAPKEVTGSTVTWVYKATLVAGDSFVQVEKGSISHVIVCAVPASVPPPALQSTGLYLYKKLDPTKDAAWNNSGLQTKIATWDTWYFKTVYPVALPSYVCGPGWGVQQDEINGPQSLFPTNIEYPNNGGFGPGVLHAARHDNLTALVTVPDCASIPDTIKVATEADPTPQTCVEGMLVDGQIHVALNPNVVYKIDGVVATTEYTAVTPGQHTVTAELANPAGNYVLDGPSSWTLTSDGFGSNCTQLVTHPLVTPVVTNANITCDAAGSFTLSDTEGVVWTVDGLTKPAGTYQVGSASTVNVVASTVSSDYGFEQGAQTEWSLVFTEPTDCGQLVTHPLVTPVVTNANITCDAAGSYTLSDTEGVVYTVNGTVQPAGTYQVASASTVNVVASTVSSDYGFEQGAQTEWSLVFTEPTDCGQLVTHPLVTPVVTSANITCDAAGSYTLTDTEGVVWTVDGLATPAGTYQVGSAKTVNVVASTSSSDYGFETGAQTVWNLVFTEPEDCGQLVTHPLVTPVVTNVDRTCTVNGSYTLASVEGVVYTVNGNVQAAGTYSVSTAKTVNVVASTSSSDYDFETGAQTVWNLVFTDPSNCAGLTTLAFTGSNGTLAGGLLIGLIFVMIGAGAITTSRLNKRTS